MARTVLIVDDEPDLLGILSSALEEEGYQTLTAPDLATAKRLLDSGPVDAILSDVRMPGGSGLELVDHCRHQPAPPPIILMTGYNDRENQPLHPGAVAVLSKPFRHDALLNTLRNTLGGPTE